MRVRWSLKRGDKIRYRTPRGRLKDFIYGRETWYGRSEPNRTDSYWRRSAGRWYRFRLPTISETYRKVLASRWLARELEGALSQPNPIIAMLKKGGGYSLGKIVTRAI